MKVLLDENLPQRLRHRLGIHEVFTVSYMGWAGLKNGELLRTAEDTVLRCSSRVTRHFPLSRTSEGDALRYLVLSTIDRDILKRNASLIVAALDTITPGSVEEVECGTFAGNG